MELLSVFINNFHPLPPESYERFKDLTRLKKFAPKEILTKAGEIPKELFILKKGIVRSYYTNENDKEYIRSIFTSISSTGSLGALVSNKPSELNYECITDC